MSPEFEEVSSQVILGRFLKDVNWEQLEVNVRSEIRLGLRHRIDLRPDLLMMTTDLLVDALTVASSEIADKFNSTIEPSTVATAAHLTAAAVANTKLLYQLKDMAIIHAFAADVRTQVVAMHAEMRLPHLGVSRSIPYEQLYVPPALCAAEEQDDPPSIDELAYPGRRHVLLGGPGAGKSTLAEKIAHDIAADLIPGVRGRVPFLVVLRNFSLSFREGGKRLAAYLERVCEAPYNVKPPEHAIDYLLSNGRAVVILDGLDELVQPDLRDTVVQLVSAFAHRYPLVPVVVTARKIGYLDAPLDHRLFRVGYFVNFDDDRVKRYATNWFNLDESIVFEQRAYSAKAFLSESEHIRELRASPLLLSLLCAMYASEHYIPRNLAQIYERCAVTLFDRWDFIRGIRLPLQFQGRLRAAVQYLAWRQFSAQESGKAMPRRHVVRILTEYLVSKQFDEDEAGSTAEQFFDFCSGRVWILTDVGMADTEESYGFTHRTFLEYFAAEHLVRTHSTPETLWAILRPRVVNGEWDLVAQIALQLIDRNVDDGADDILKLVMSERLGNRLERARLNTFAARSLSYVHPSRNSVRLIVESALCSALAWADVDRFRYWVGSIDYSKIEQCDGPLRAVMYECAPGNLNIVKQVIVDGLQNFVEQGSEAARFVVHGLSRHYLDANERRVEYWQSARAELLEVNEAEFGTWLENWKWYTDPGRVAESFRVIVRTFGPKVLYLSDLFLTGSSHSWVEILRQDADMRQHIHDHSKEICWELIGAEVPWIPRDRWIGDLNASEPGKKISSRYSRIIYDILNALEPNVAYLLCLPYLETIAHPPFAMNLGEQSEHLGELIASRKYATNRREAESRIKSIHLAPDVQDYLTRWMLREFSIIGP